MTLLKHWEAEQCTRSYLSACVEHCWSADKHTGESACFSPVHTSPWVDCMHKYGKSGGVWLRLVAEALATQHGFSVPQCRLHICEHALPKMQRQDLPYSTQQVAAFAPFFYSSSSPMPFDTNNFVGMFHELNECNHNTEHQITFPQVQAFLTSSLRISMTKNGHKIILQIRCKKSSSFCADIPKWTCINWLSLWSGAASAFL